MACGKDELRHVPLFALLDDDELTLLASLVELRKFGARQRIYKIGDAPDRAYVMLSGMVRVTTFDEDHQEVVVDEAARVVLLERSGRDGGELHGEGLRADRQ